MTKVLLVGNFRVSALELSYKSAFEESGCEVNCFDISSSVDRNCRLGFFGRTFNKFVTVWPWVRKANREMVLSAKAFGPKVIVVFGQNPVQPGAISQIKSMLNAYIIFIWPDTLVNLSSLMISVLPLYDLVATYSKSTLDSFKALGANNVIWLPLAADPKMHLITDPITYKKEWVADVSFIGQWRPEREAAVTHILKSLPGINLKIWGPDWGRRCKGKAEILACWQGKPLYEKDFASIAASSRINLNIIDETNYPAANMRFFELAISRGLQVSSCCPEMNDEFVDGRSIFYYESLDDLIRIIGMLLSNYELKCHVTENAFNLAQEKHTYLHRVEKILSLIDSQI